MRADFKLHIAHASDINCTLGVIVAIDNSTEQTLLRSNPVDEALAKRQRYLSSLVEVERCLLSFNGDEDCYDGILKALGQVAGASYACVLQRCLDYATATMRVCAEWWAPDTDPHPSPPFLKLINQPNTGWGERLAQGEVVSATAWDLPEPERSSLASQKVQAVLILPLLVKGEWFGCLSFDNRVTARSWDAEEIELLQLAAAAIGLNHERKQTEMQLQRQAEQVRATLHSTQLVSTIASRIRQSLNLDEILHTTVDEVQHLLQVERVLIYHFHNTPNRSGVLVAEATASAWTLPDEIKLQETQLWRPGAKMERYEQGYIRIINDPHQADVSIAEQTLMDCLQVQAKLVMPILQGNHLWGLLVTHQCSETRSWQKFEVDLLQQLATQLAIAIQQAQLFSQVQQQSQREQLLNRISRTLSSSLDPDYILQEIVKLTGEGFKVDRVNLTVIETSQVRVLYEWCVNEHIASMLNFQSPTSSPPDLLAPGSAFHARQAFHAPNYAAPPLTPSRLAEIQQMQTRSVLGAPIFIQDRLFGGLVLHTTLTDRVFTEDEIHLLQSIADQTAIALYNAQSYERLEQLVQERTQELKREKQISETANRAKSEFLASMSHELRTPLNAVLGLSQLLQQQVYGPLNAKQEEYINCIYSSGEHLLSLINDILDLAKVESGKEELNLSAVEIAGLCQSCMAIVREQADKQGLELVSQIDPAAGICIADERRLKQMLLNLLSNAIKFTPVGGVSLIVEVINPTATSAIGNATEGNPTEENPTESEGILITVADTGIGIPAEKISELFQPFYQLDSGLNRQFMGTGLGLYLTRSLARLHNGDVTVESILAQGSQFHLYLPRRQPQDTLETASVDAKETALQNQNNLTDFTVTPHFFRAEIILPPDALYPQSSGDKVS